MWICEFLGVYSSSQLVCGSLLPVELISDDNQAKTEIKIWGFNLSASNLLRAGIEFEKGEDNLLNITLSNGKLRIPPVYIHLTSDSLFRNLMAYEQCSLRSTHHITSYLILMKSLITSTRDIRLLRRRGIINLLNRNRVGDQEYFVEFKNKLNTVVVKDFCFGKLCDEVNAYTLFVLTVIRTYYSIHPR
ncbi:hypothetical protein C1H46_023128 [Malus baccata]|uniref:Uncharacterized protein n=1 Tax=Malus baccata TaxID=106549 RepID=A0A540LXS0_MALBA|nr:hypothetical protein C1H46_023128 [Malus baccata]